MKTKEQRYENFRIARLILLMVQFILNFKKGKPNDKRIKKLTNKVCESSHTKKKSLESQTFKNVKKSLEFFNFNFHIFLVDSVPSFFRGFFLLLIKKKVPPLNVEFYTFPNVPFFRCFLLKRLLINSFLFVFQEGTSIFNCLSKKPFGQINRWTEYFRSFFSFSFVLLN